MACFSVPLTAAAVATAVKSTLPETTHRNPFVAKLGWLCKMMLGGSFLLAVEHIYNGEVIFSPPFLSAVRDGTVPEMLREMATRGVAMAVAVSAVWAAMVATSALLDRSRSAAAAPHGA